MPRQSGHRVTIRGFLPTDRKSVKSQHDATELILKAQTDAEMRSGLADALLDVSVDARVSSREVPEKGAPK